MSKKAKTKKAKEPRGGQADLHFGRRNYYVLGAALAAIALGFVLLSQGSITAAPLLLVLGYCVLVPYGLATGNKRSRTPSS